MTYQDALDAAVFNRQHDAYYAAEIRSARHEAEVEDLATKIGDEVIAGNSQRRATYTEEIVDTEAWLSFVRDLLDDVRNNVDPTGTIKQSIYNWALTVAEYEVSRGEV